MWIQILLINEREEKKYIQTHIEQKFLRENQLKKVKVTCLFEKSKENLEKDRHSISFNCICMYIL